MSDPVTAPSTEAPATTAPAAPTAPSTPSIPGTATIQRRFDKAATFLAGRSAPAPAAEPVAVAETVQAETTPVTDPEKPADPPETAKPDPRAADRQLAKAQAALLRHQQEAVEAKKQAKALEERLKSYGDFEGVDLKAAAEAFKSLSSKDAKAVHKLLKQSGLTVEDMARVTLDEPDQPEDPKDLELKALRADMERIKAEKEAEIAEAKAEKERLEAEREAAAATAETEKVYQHNVSYVTDILKHDAAKYPALASFQRAPAEAVRRFNAHIEEHGAPSDAAGVNELLGGILKSFNDAVLTDVTSILADDSALKAYLDRPEIKIRALSLLGVKQSATSPASTEGDAGQRKGAPSAIPSTAAADAGSRKSRPLTQDEKVAAALRSLSEKTR
jgi:hypothetical protein